VELKRARIVPASDVDPSTRRAKEPVNGARIVPGELVDAHLEAARILEAARAEAHAIVEGARQGAAGVAAEAAKRAAEEEKTKLAAAHLAVHAHAEQAAERDLERSVQLARILAERLVGRALADDPRVVADLARQALSEARGARRAKLRAHPDDAAILAPELGTLGLPAGSLEIAADPTLARGALVVETELGRLDVQVGAQLDRLADALRAALHGSAGALR
jgi:flagellar biosynthesis/type III secretory pathway protein FliH